VKIHIDRGRCTGVGLCESFCPEMFEVDDDGWLNLIVGDEISDRLAPDVDIAIRRCPNAALSKQE
jgi:ferredoxin